MQFHSVARANVIAFTPIQKAGPRTDFDEIEKAQQNYVITSHSDSYEIEQGM
jgi:hypothetical protein